VVERPRNAADMQQIVDRNLRRFLRFTSGYDGNGWPLGGAVRRSQLFRLLEDISGVDHVEALTLAPANADGDVELDPRQLPVWETLSVQVKRA
jgi:hypothetical protein